MDKHSKFQSPQPNKTPRYSQKLEVCSNHSLRCFYENKQSFFSNDSQTKASSIISAGTHQNSFDFSQTSFQNQPNKADDFLREEYLLERKVIQNQLTLSEEYFSKQFIQHLKILLSRFAENPINDSFHKFLQLIIKPKINIFSDQFSQINPQNKSSTLKQAMQLLVGESKNQYFIHTFSLIICPLAFYIILIIYWIEPKLAIQDNGCFVKKQISKQNNSIISQTKVKENIIKIGKAYIQNHSQQINQNQLLFLIIMYFLDELKNFKSQSSALTSLQKDLAKDIKTFRSINHVEKVFGKQKYQRFQTKLNKFEKSNPFITATDATYHMIKSYIFEIFGSISLQKIYQINEFNEYRKQYQLKKDAFCFWILKNILKNQQKTLQTASLHIIKLMQMLKKFKLENNIEGISYLVPTLANLKTFLPKAWRHVVKRRPEIQKKLSQYVDLMLQHRFKLAYLQQNGIIWGQTNFIMAQKILKHIDEHKKYYTDFLSHFLYYRNKSKLRLMQPKFQLVIENQTQIGFSIGLVQNYLSYKYSKQTLSQQWNLLMERANKINQNISQSLISDILDYCFVGSTQKYQQADL